MKTERRALVSIVWIVLGIGLMVACGVTDGVADATGVVMGFSSVPVLLMHAVMTSAMARHRKRTIEIFLRFTSFIKQIPPLREVFCAE